MAWLDAVRINRAGKAHNYVYSFFQRVGPFHLDILIRMHHVVTQINGYAQQNSKGCGKTG